MYFLPDLAGFHGELQHFRGENAGNSANADDGTGNGVRVGYRAGPLNVAIAHARTQYARTATTGDITSSNIAARYAFGDFTAMGGYYRDNVNSIAGRTGSGIQIGGIYRIGPGDIKVQWSQYKTTAAGDPETKKLSVGYVHNLSKRTALYGTYARVRNRGGATVALNGSITEANQSSSGFDIGLRRSF
jgi:predicted porin